MVYKYLQKVVGFEGPFEIDFYNYTGIGCNYY